MKNIGQLMKQAQEMQSRMQAMQEKLAAIEVEGAAGGGMVKVTVNGKNETRRVEIDASLFKPDDKGVVEDLIVAGLGPGLGGPPVDEPPPAEEYPADDDIPESEF